MQARSTRNRKRSKRRQIFCPSHGCLVDSTSRKYTLYADRVEHLKQRGMGNKTARLVVANHTTVALKGEWLEQFWCSECQAKHWYYIQETAPRSYDVSFAPMELWHQAQGVIHPKGNPSVGEFTRRQSKMMSYRGVKDFQAIG